MSHKRAVGGCIVLVFFAIFVASISRQPAEAAPVPKADLGTTEKVVDCWYPVIKGTKTDKFGGLLDYDDKHGVGAHTFNVTGASFEDVWNFYAAKCGAKDRRYDPKVFLQSRSTGGKNSPSWSIADRQAGDNPTARLESYHVSTFTYRDRTNVVTVTIQPKRDGSDAIIGVLTVVLVDEAK